MGSGMTVAAVSCTGHAELGERPYQISLADALNVLKTRTVATFALDVVVHRVLDRIVSGNRSARGIALTRHGMASVTCRGFARTCVQCRVGTCVLGFLPATLEVHVAIAARRLLCRRVVVAEEP